MTSQMIILLLAFVASVLLLAVPMGRWLAAVGDGKPLVLDRTCNAVLQACGVQPEREQGWLEYAVALLLLPWLASRFVREGDAAHATGYAQAARRRQAMRMASGGGGSGGELLRHQGRAGQVFSALFMFIYRRWTPYVLATAQATPRSALARAGS